jgi:hypothetical protein
VSGRGFACKEAIEALRGARTLEDAVLPLAIETGMVRGLMIEESTFRTLSICGGFSTLVGGVCEEVALLAWLLVIASLYRKF